MTEELITDNHTLVGAKDKSGYNLQIYDDGYGPLWVAGYQFGPQFIIRAQDFYTAYEIFEDEFADEATEEDVLRDYWFDFLEENKPLDLGGEEPTYGKLRDKFWEWVHNDACFQENYGYRPSGGLYVKDHYFWIRELDARLLQDHEIQLELEEERDTD